MDWKCFFCKSCVFPGGKGNLARLKRGSDCSKILGGRFFHALKKHPLLLWNFKKSTIFAADWKNMEIKFEKKYLCELYETGKTTDKKHRFQPHVAAKYRKTIDILGAVASVQDLYLFNALHYEVLKGDKKGISSVRVNDQYRIEFTASQVITETVVTICNIIELSNHYK